MRQIRIIPYLHFLPEKGKQVVRRNVLLVSLLLSCLALSSCFSYSPDTGLVTPAGMLVDSLLETTKDSVLRHAVYDCNPLEAKKALTQGVNPNFYKTGRQPLIVAAVSETSCESKTKLDLIELLINNGANVNARGYGKCTALAVACMRHDFSIMKLLVQHGANIKLSCSTGENIERVANNFGFQGLAVYCLVDGERSIFDISRETGFSQEQVSDVVNHLSAEGIIK